jgi:hypothetical protein
VAAGCGGRRRAAAPRGLEVVDLMAPPSQESLRRIEVADGSTQRGVQLSYFYRVLAMDPPVRRKEGQRSAPPPFTCSNLALPIAT